MKTKKARIYAGVTPHDLKSRRVPYTQTAKAIKQNGVRQAIVTRYHGPGNVKGSRVSATASAGRIYLEWDDALDSEANHIAAAEAFCAKWDWKGDLVAGGLPDGSTVFVIKDFTS